jgi:DNA polymerase-3 subunit epsilon/CBS domain-containing protein
MFGGIRTEAGRVDLKKTALFGIVTTARVLAIRHHVVERSTPARLSDVIALGHGGAHDLGVLAQAQGVILDLILAQQIADIERGLPPGNKVAVKRLTAEERTRLQSALAAVAHLNELTRDLLF